MKKPKVTLISHTKNPVETLTAVWQASRDNEPVDLENRDRDLFQKIIDSKIPVAEMLDFVFLLENISIAFREQMVRHRIGVKVGDRLGVDLVPDLADSSWWSQSMRVLDMGSFAQDNAFSVPDYVSEVDEKKGNFLAKIYGNLMDHAEDCYNELVKRGMPEEEARLVLPLACHHRVVWKLNLAALMHIIGKRSCWILQLGFWQPIIEGMVWEIVEKVDPAFQNLINPPCMKGDEYKGCLFCLDNQKRSAGEDPLPPCPLWFGKEAGTKQQDQMEQRMFHEPDLQPQVDRMTESYQKMWGRNVCTGKKIEACLRQE